MVDDHITGVLSEHQAGKVLDVPPTGIRIAGHRSTPGRYFRVAEPGNGWGGTNIENPLSILKPFNPKVAWTGLRLFMVSTTGEQCAYYELDQHLVPQVKPVPKALKASADLIAENCEPSVASVMFMAGAGGSLRAGVTENPVRLTHSVKDALTRVTCGGADAFVWPGGGITVMVDVLAMPEGSFGYVPTPALVAPIEFTMARADYGALGGHEGEIRTVESVITEETRVVAGNGRARVKGPGRSARLSGDRLHLQHGPIDLVLSAEGDREPAFRAAVARFTTVLDELVAELPLLRQAVFPGSPHPVGRIARAMHRAVNSHAAGFVTPMAAVAGAVADEILEAMKSAAALRRASVNNGGDIALHLADGARFDLAMRDHANRDLGRIGVTAGDGVGGIATSGRHGRSHSLGIADSVTVVARTAAEADAAATLIANAVDLPGHPSVRRAAASTLSPDSDLGDRPVVTGCGPLTRAEAASALDRGLARAREMRARGLIGGAALFLRREVRVAGIELTLPVGA